MNTNFEGNFVPKFLRLVDCQSIDSSVTGTTDETELYSFVIPGGTLGANGTLRVEGLAAFTNNANDKKLRVKFGGIQFGLRNYTNAGSATFVRKISNQNSESSQIGAASFMAPIGDPASGVVITASIDTSVNQTLQITGELGNAGDTMGIAAVEVYISKE